MIHFLATRPYKKGYAGNNIPGMGVRFMERPAGTIYMPPYEDPMTYEKYIKPVCKRRMKIYKFKDDLHLLHRTKHPVLRILLMGVRIYGWCFKPDPPIFYTGICKECGTTQVKVPMVLTCTGCTKQTRERDDCFEEFWEKIDIGATKGDHDGF